MGWNDQIPSAFPLRRRIFFRNQHVGAPKRVQAGQIPSTFAKPWRFFFRNQHANAPKMLWRGQIPSTFAKSWCFFCIWWKRITTLPCKKCCRKMGCSPGLPIRLQKFWTRNQGSPYWRNPNAVAENAHLWGSMDPNWSKNDLFFSWCQKPRENPIKKAVGKSDPLAFLKSGGIFLQSAKTDHHSDVTKRLWENGSPRVSWHIASFFGHSPRFFRTDFDVQNAAVLAEHEKDGSQKSPDFFFFALIRYIYF